MKKRSTVPALCAAASMLLTACSIDVNSLASASSEPQTESTVSMTETDTESQSDVFYTYDSESDSAEGSEVSKIDSETDSAAAFDESKYLTMFVSGAAEISMTADAIYGSKEVASLKYGEKVSIVRQDITEYCFVYSASAEKFGYIRTEYLADYREEATPGDIMYTKPAKADIYTDAALSQWLETVSQNTILTILVKRTDGKWRAVDAQGRICYIDKNLLSDKMVKAESSKSESKKTHSIKPESVAESKPESVVVSKPESIAESRPESIIDTDSEPEIAQGLYTGKGDAPSEYVTYIVDVDVGYLSLRSAPDIRAKSIGELYYEQQVYVIDTNGDYWYIYAPTLGMYGYVTGDLNYLYPAE